MSKPYYADVVRHYARKAELFSKADGFFATVSPDAKCKACAVVCIMGYRYGVCR